MSTSSYLICRLERLLGKAKGMLETFEPLMGRIEITNVDGRIERVYFEIRQQNIDQWEKPQIKESKRTFLHSVVAESGDKEKLECFVNFAEDTIFEMQHAEEISGDDDNLQISRVRRVVFQFDFICYKMRPSQNNHLTVTT